MNNTFFKFSLLIAILLLHMIFSGISELSEPLFLTYKVYDKKVEYISNNHGEVYDTIYYLYCNESDLGKFKINVEENTYKNKKVNDYIKFQNGLTRNELLKYSIDNSTKAKEKIIKDIKNSFCRVYVINDFFNLLIWVSIFVLVLSIIYLFVIVLSNDFNL